MEAEHAHLPSMMGRSTGTAAWAKEFFAPIYIHAKDRQWVTEPCSRIEH